MNTNLTFCTNTAVIQGINAIGGLAGTAYMTNKPELKYCKNKGYIKGNSKVGGIIGEVTNDRLDSVNFIIKESYNQGDIEAGSVVGGITGHVAGNITILYCYNIGSVKAIDAGVVGGIAGRLNLYLTAMASVYMCYNSGLITAKGTLIGGIVGYNNSIVTKCFLLGNGVLDIGGGPNLNGCKILTASGLRNLGGEIKEPYIEDANLINSGYPILNSINYAEEDRGGSTFSYSSGNERDYSSTYFYTDNYFTKSSYEYNASLASMSICFAMSAFASNWGESYENKSRNARQLLEDAGFSNIKTNRYFMEKPGTDSIGAIAGHKQLTTSSGANYTLIALAVRGAGYQKEWAGNFKLGETGQHEGFQMKKLEGDYVILPSGIIVQYPKVVDDMFYESSQSIFLNNLLNIISKEVFKSREYYVSNIQDSLRNACDIIFGREEGDWPHFTETLKNKLNNNIVWIVASTTSAFS